MTITITFRDGSKAEYTNCSAFTYDSECVQFAGTDESGNTATWFIPWSTIKILGKIIT
jgi:hypothetical protein